MGFSTKKFRGDRVPNTIFINSVINNYSIKYQSSVKKREFQIPLFLSKCNHKRLLKLIA